MSQLKQIRAQPKDIRPKITKTAQNRKIDARKQRFPVHKDSERAQPKVIRPKKYETRAEPKKNACNPGKSAHKAPMCYNTFEFNWKEMGN
ncbi:hypothetical protein BBV17_16815 [Cytobacillus oceanisediminis]|uniref:Uncharacterized protein n=1 Tax=Cytobacillus oceanisediminis TaxID=665099 RepID=A0ABX3CSN2_9BACI|nr:hypothetical protein BBV17_16815 [Cytobacillus oceanisediminis]